MKHTNRKDLLIFLIVILAITYLKSIYFYDIYEGENWQYQLFIYFGSEQFVNIIWLIPIIVQVFFISKNVYMEMCHFDLRYRNRKHLLKQVMIYFMKEHTLYTIISIVVQMLGLMLIMKVPMYLESYMIEFICQYFMEIMFYITLLVTVSLLTSHYILSFIAELTILIGMLMIFKNSYIPVMTLFCDYHFNYITVPCIFMTLYIIKKIYIAKDLLGGIRYDTKD